MNRFEIFSDIRKSLVVSTGLHLLLLLLFLGISVGIDFSPSEFAEIGFVSATGSSAALRPDRRQQPVEQFRPQPQRAEEAAKPEQSKAPKAEPVNLPKRRMLEKEEPLITNRNQGKLTPAVDGTKVTPSDQVYQGRQITQDISGTRVGERTPQIDGGDFAGAHSQTPTTDVGPVGKQQPYSIEGDAARRTVINQLIPQYPPGLQREAVVRIRFFVFPDGSVGQMIPVQKGDPVLEDITMNALRQWRFNPLPPGAEQKNVTGIITFRYELQ